MLSDGENDFFDPEVEESEKAVLSSVLYHFPEVESLVNIDSVNYDQFCSKAAKRILQAIKSTELVDGKYDFVSVLGSLKKICVNEGELEKCVDYLNNLSEDIHYFSVNKYLKVLQSNKIKRDLNQLASEISRKRLSVDNYLDVLEDWKNKFDEIITNSPNTNYIDADHAVKSFEELVSNSGKLGSSNFLKTQYYDVDKKIKALSGGQLIIIASRPGVGKTTFALNLIYNNFEYINKNSKEGKTIGVFSLEMTYSSLIAKLIAIDAKVELNQVQKLIDGTPITVVESRLIEKSKAKISNLNLLFCDESNITIGKIIATIKQWVKSYNLKLVIIDYLQLINVSDEKKNDFVNQYQKIGMISRSLKILSMEMNICIIALAQLNRKAEERRGAEKSPILSDLRESGSIEQDADVVMFLYEEKKEMEEESQQETEESDKSDSYQHLTMLKIAKNRHGPIGKIEFKFNKSLGVYKLFK
ncbi:replicative DNA helicase [Candidatus Mycoplasma haematohominis]|uniref:DNA 5'-3' helicase n=1 Tax=Candidatus Mycoplasma haematohominis TaxID=1494318 RepID=A0A478FRZ4_9MOLU|nr:replicative DNA helicase [Candidatus Mycoplasma haemohominis]